MCQEQAAAAGFRLAAHPAELLAQARLGSGLFLLGCGHPHGTEGMSIAAHVAIEALDQRAGVQSIRLLPFAAVQFLRGDGIIGRAQRGQFAMQPVAQRPGLVATVEFGPARHLHFDPADQLRLDEALRRLRRGIIELPTDRDLPRVHIQPQFDDFRFGGRRVAITLRDLSVGFHPADRLAVFPPPVGFMSSMIYLLQAG